MNSIFSLILLGASFSWLAVSADPATTVNPATMPVIGTIDERFQSFNTEMLEVTGGRFWKPYRGMLNEARRRRVWVLIFNGYRPPIDLTQVRLRKLAAALGPA